jgi:hypothetical protein
MKCCKIISTCFNDRHERKRDQWSNDIIKWPAHIQFGYSPHGVLAMLKDQISLERDVDAGFECDTIVVNSRNGFAEGDDYIRDIQGLPTKSGKIYSMTMDNIGGQFGAYDCAYRVFAGKYDYWMFDEDDIVITGHHYYKTLVDRLESYEFCYALIGLVEHPHHPITAGGALLLLHNGVLYDMKNVFGRLPHPMKNDYDSRIQEGEIAWTRKLFELGYEIVYKGKSKQNVTVEWDYKTDYCLPYREMIEEYYTVENFKQTTFYRGVGWDALWSNVNDKKTRR